MHHVFYVDTPTDAARLIDRQGLLGTAEIHWSNPFDWTWDEHRWLFDPLYHAAVTVIVRLLERLFASRQGS